MKTVPYSALAAALFALTIAGCAAYPDERATCALTPPTAIADYTCENADTVSVIWWDDVAEVSLGAAVWCLPQVRSGSGARYSDGLHEVWEHQGDLRVLDGTGLETVCRIASQN